MNKIVKLYKNKPLRIIVKDGKPWFVAKDVANILGYSKTSEMLRRLHEDEMEKISSKEIPDATSMAHEYTIINKRGLLHTTFGTKKPEAKRFERWVLKDVLSSIYKSKVYNVPETEDVSDLANAFEIMKNCLEENNEFLRKELEDRMRRIKLQNEQQKHTGYVPVLLPLDVVLELLPNAVTDCPSA